MNNDNNNVIGEALVIDCTPANDGTVNVSVNSEGQDAIKFKARVFSTDSIEKINNALNHELETDFI